MKTTIPFKLVLLISLMPLTILANTALEGVKITKEKTIKKSFNVSESTTLKVDNSYGNLDIITWNENRIEFNITIKVTGNSIEKTQDRLDAITINFSNTNDLVSAITKFGKKEKSWWSWRKTNKLKIEVNYRIKMPMTNNVDLSNDYGTVNLDKLKGVAKIACNYGKITTKELMADNNDIRFDYTKNSYFEYIKSGRIRADYSGFTVAKTKDLILIADYSKSIIEASEAINYICDYGSLKINKINKIEGHGDYLTLRIGDVFNTAKLKADYGSIKIERMTSKIKNVVINSEFVGITIGYDATCNFDFDFDMQYGSLRASDRLNFINKEVNSFDKHYNGYYGKKGSGNIVRINSEYGSITLKKL